MTSTHAALVAQLVHDAWLAGYNHDIDGAVCEEHIEAIRLGEAAKAALAQPGACVADERDGTASLKPCSSFIESSIPEYCRTCNWSWESHQGAERFNDEMPHANCNVSWWMDECSRLKAALARVEQERDDLRKHLDGLYEISKDSQP